jgi:CheY-like chemotaxis protein
MIDPPTGHSAEPAPDLGAFTGDALRTMRHDLRTPVNHIIGYSEMLLEETEEHGLEALASDLQLIHAAGKQLLMVINDSLDPARVAARLADRTLPRPDFHTPLGEISERAKALQIAAENQQHAELVPDLQKIERAAGQLLILIDDRYGLTRAGSQVADVAAGASAESAGPAPQAAHAARSDYGTLLVVDDNEMNRDMLSRRLERLGYTVATAENGRQAIEMIAAQPFDLVLLDIMMPELNGYQVLEHLKADETLRHLPVIVLSALDEIESVARCIEMGAVDHLLKPFDPVLLRARIGACLEQKRLHDMEMSYRQQIEREKKRADDLLNIVIPIGVALSAEKDFNRLLEKILVEAKQLCNADGGTLYLRTEDDLLKFVMVQNDSLGIAMGGTTGVAIPFPPLRLYDEATGAPNDRYVVTHAALTGATITISDAYKAEGFDFSGTKAFDEQTGYRSTSFVNVPLKDGTGQVLGVLQLINAQDQADGALVPFDRGLQQMVESLSLLAAVALGAYAREQRLRQQIEELRIEIDESRKARQVAEITETDYFQTLQQKARKMRGENRESGQ